MAELLQFKVSALTRLKLENAQFINFLSFIGKFPKDHIGILLYADTMCKYVFKNIKRSI